MKHALDEIGMCRKRLSIEFSPEEVDAVFRDSYDELDGMVQVRGFRRGKAPRRLLEKKYAQEVAKDVAMKLAQKHLPEIMKEEKIAVMGEVGPVVNDHDPKPGEPLAIHTEFDVRPQFELPEYKDLQVGGKIEAVGEADIDKSLESYQRMLADYDPVEEPAAAGDVVEVDVLATVEGAEILNLKEQKIRVEGNELFGLPCPGLEARLTGARAGDRMDLPVDMPENHPEKDWRGKRADVAVTILRVLRGKLAELNDAFAARIGMKDMAAMRQRTRAILERERAGESRTALENEIMDKIIGAASFDVPPSFLQAETAAVMEQNRMRLARSGMKGEAVEERLAGMRDEGEKAAERRLRWSIIAGAIAEKEGLEVSPNEVGSHIEALAGAYRTTPAKMLKRIQSYDGMGSVVAEIRDFKVMQMIIDASSAKNEHGSMRARAEADGENAGPATGAGPENAPLPGEENAQ